MPIKNRALRTVEEIEHDATHDDPPFDTDESTQKPSRPVRREAPRASNRSAEGYAPDTPKNGVSSMATGWDAADKVLNRPSESAGFTPDFKWTETPTVVKFLSDDPIVYQQHWVERAGKKSFICAGADCPLCSSGNKATTKALFTIVDLSEDEPRDYQLVVGIKVLKQLSALHSDERTGPLTRQFWALSATGERQQRAFVINPVKPRDLDEDWGISQEDAEAVIDAFEPVTEDDLDVRTPEELRQIAREMV